MHEYFSIHFNFYIHGNILCVLVLLMFYTLKLYGQKYIKIFFIIMFSFKNKWLSLTEQFIKKY